MAGTATLLQFLGPPDDHRPEFPTVPAPVVIAPGAQSLPVRHVSLGVLRARTAGMLGQCEDGCGLCTDASCIKVRANSRNASPHSSEPCFLEHVCVHASLLGEDVVTEGRSLRRRVPPTHPLQVCKGSVLLLHGVRSRPARECVFLVNVLETTSR